MTNGFRSTAVVITVLGALLWQTTHLSSAMEVVNRDKTGTTGLQLASAISQDQAGQELRKLSFLAAEGKGLDPQPVSRQLISNRLDPLSLLIHCH